MGKKILGSPIFWSSGEFVVVFVVELIIIKALELKEYAVHATVLAAAFWLFLSLLGFYHHLEHRIEKFEAMSLGFLRPVLTTPAFGELATKLPRLLANYQAIEHPLLRELAEHDLATALQRIDFDEKQSSEISHEDFGFAVERYVRHEVHRVRAFSRSTVTNWDRMYAAATAYRDAQKGKRVTRIFVLRDAAEYSKFAERILPVHESEFGAENLLICCQTDVNRWIQSLPAASRIEEDEDFAIFDDDIVAFCKGNRVCVRSDNLHACRTVFQVVDRYALELNQTYAALKSGAVTVESVFGEAPAAFRQHSGQR